MIYKFVDVCQPADMVSKECSELESKGYILLGQHGGGDLGSSLEYGLPENEEDRDMAQNMHDNHMDMVEEYRRYMNRYYNIF